MVVFLQRLVNPAMKRNPSLLKKAALAAFFISAAAESAPQLAFPEADGYGRFTVGGRGGQVYVITSLDDQPDSPKPGTLRHAVKQKGPRTIVFATSGVIHLKKPLEIKQDFITIAGQSSPGGIVLRGAPVQIKADQVILRYLRVRLGSVQENEDAISARYQKNIIIDHCSFSWSVDEVASFYGNINFTLQYSIIAQSLNASNHEKGDHGYGGIWGGAGASFHHNVLAHNNSRNPRINGWRLGSPYAQDYELVDIRYNTIYNWKSNAAYGSENAPFNLIGNTFAMGPATEKARILQFYRNKKSEAFGTGHFQRNRLLSLEGEPLTPRIEIKDYKGAQESPSVKALVRMRPLEATQSPFFPEAPAYRFQDTTEDAYDKLIETKEVGANRQSAKAGHDSVDLTVLNSIGARSAGTQGTGIIDSENEVIVSWEAYSEEFATLKSDQAQLADLDEDGMPDAWEAKHGIEHAHHRDLHEHYTNIEVYLNDLGRFSTSAK